MRMFGGLQTACHGPNSLVSLACDGQGARMSVMQSEVFEAFRAIDVPEDKALKAATALSRRDDEVASIKADTLLLKWMLGFVLAFQVGIFVKLFM
jgi:hypothetical protein